MAFSAGSHVWISDPDEIVIPAVVEATFSAGTEGRVKRLDNERSVKLPAAETKKLMVMHEQSLEGLDDMVNFKQLDENAILHNLRLRYFQDTIYTNIGKILTSVNPFKQLSIYNPQVMDEYMEKGSRNLPAHIFGVADDSFKALIENQQSQSCIVSGESGAGKTEATKLFLQYISEKSKRASAGATHERQSGHVSGHIMQQKILESNPLMEAFGNAKTLRNDNSSRFGKWIEIQFDRNSGAIVGGSIKSYLLEKSRIVSQADGERNYHIFYQLCSAAEVDPKLGKYNLTEATQYHYLNQSEEPANSDNINDLDDWEATINAMHQIGITPQEQHEIINLLNSVMTIGNTVFTGKEQAAIEKKEPVESVATMLGCSYADLERALVKIYRGNSKEPDLVGNHDISQACDARDAFAKHLYALLFDWIIAKINEALGRVPDNANKISTIGVLDIFGFEFFQKNSLEQLLINFTNERLQGHFNDHIFKLEQEQYAKEGIDVTKIEFVDNENVLQTIDYKTTGVLQMIAEELKLQKGSDDGLLKKLKAKADQLKNDPRMNILGYPDNKEVKADPELENVFTIQHYAGKVGYRIDQFLEKNRDSVPKLLHMLGAKCKNAFVAGLFKGTEDMKKKALGLRFSEQLNDLMNDLNATQPHFVRTIKPNKTKERDNFESRMVMEQLRYAGLLEVCRIRQMGYPIRKTFKEFVDRYRYLAKGASGIKTHTDLIAVLKKLKLMDDKKFQIGSSKVFLKNDQSEILEEERGTCLSLFVTRMQRVVRGFIVRVLARKWNGIRSDLRKAIKTREKGLLKSALLQYGELPYGGKHLSEYREANDLMNRIEDEERISKLLKDAMNSRDIMQIQAALKAAEQKKLSGSKEAKEAQKLVELLQKENECKAALVSALEKSDEAALKNAISAAKALNLGESSELKDAVALLKQIETVRNARANLEGALKSKNVAKIKEFMNQLANLGKGDDPLVHQGEEFVHEKAQEAAAIQARKEQALYSLEKAIKGRNLQALIELEKEIIELGIETDLVKKARELKHDLSAEKDICAKLTAESNAATAKGQTKVGLVESDLEGLRAVIAEASEVLEADDFQLLSAMDDLYKLEKQLEVQVELSKALEKYSTKKREWSNEKDNAKRDTLAAELLSLLKEANRNAQESGTNTDVANEVREKLSQLQLDIDESKRAENQAKREEASKKLVDASEDDMEQDAAKRAQFNAQFTDLLSQKHRELIQEASDTNRFHLARFYRIRSDDDFVEKVPHDQKELIAATKLVSRVKPIPKSLCRVDEDQNAIAVRINKAILQYCGDLAATFPGTLAQYVLVRGLEDPSITDEIYLQLMKHLSGNEKVDSADKAWLLMCMCTKIFPPTNEFAPYLLNFLIQRKTAPGLVGNYARLCIVQLDATIELGATWFKPNIDEINSYRKRPPILASIHTLEGKQIDYPVTPDMRVAQVLDLVRRKEGVEDDYEHPAWGIYVAAEEEEDNQSPKERLIRFYQFYNPAKLAHIDLFLDHWTENPEELFQKLTYKYGPEPVLDDKTKKKGMLSLPITAAMNAVKFLGFANQRDTPPAPETPWPLPWWTHLGDVYYRMTKQKKVPKFVFKRRLITRAEPVDRWLYLQAVDDIRQGYLPLNDPSKLAQLAALALQFEHGEAKIQSNLSAPALLDLGLGRYLPEEALKQKGPLEYASVVLNLYKKKQVPGNSDEIMLVYIDIVRQLAIYGMNFFYARHAASEKNYVISVDVDGIHVLEEDRSAVKRSFGFHTIKKFGATAEYFWMNIDERQEPANRTFAFLSPNQGINVLLYTLQSWEMYDCVYDATHIEVE